jgi:hypothetical protein
MVGARRICVLGVAAALSSGVACKGKNRFIIHNDTESTVRVSIDDAMFTVAANQTEYQELAISGDTSLKAIGDLVDEHHQVMVPTSSCIMVSDTYVIYDVGNKGRLAVVAMPYGKTSEPPSIRPLTTPVTVLGSNEFLSHTYVNEPFSSSTQAVGYEKGRAIRQLCTLDATRPHGIGCRLP